MATKPKTKRPKNEVIKSTAANLLKQLSGYWRDLPVGELRTNVGELVKEVEVLSTHIDETFPKVEDDGDVREDMERRDRYQ